MLFTSTLSKPSVRRESNDKTSRGAQDSIGFCLPLEETIEEDGRQRQCQESQQRRERQEIQERDAKRVLAVPTHCLDVMVVLGVRQPVPEPEPEPRRVRYYKHHLCGILWRVLVFVMLPRYCLSLAGKSPLDRFGIALLLIITIGSLLLHNLSHCRCVAMVFHIHRVTHCITLCTHDVSLDAVYA